MVVMGDISAKLGYVGKAAEKNFARTTLANVATG